MLVSEPLLEGALHSKDMMHDTRDEADETLSFCDLPLYSDQSVEEWEEEDLSTESQGSSSISSSEQDYFEFFSQELSPSATSFPPENIIFCGKLIPYKQSHTSEKEHSSRSVQTKKQTNIEKKHTWGIFKWDFGSTRSSKNQVQSKTGKKSTIIQPKRTHSGNKDGKGYDFPAHNMSILTSSSSGKSRWYLFLFGISRFSTEVELRDIKSRQSRRHLSAPPQSPAIRFQNHHNNKVSGERNRGSGLWGLIKVLSCGENHHPNAMVVSSIGCVRQE